MRRSGGPIRQILQQVSKADSVTYEAVLKRKHDAQQSAIRAVGAVWSAGATLDVSKVNSRSEAVTRRMPLTDLPKYPWNHENRYWSESSLSKSLRFRHAPRTDLLGEPIREFTWAEPTWKNYIYVAEQPWIADHVVRGSDVFPAAAMICSAIEGVKQCAAGGRTIKSFDLRDIVVSRALMIPASDPGVEVFTKLRPQRMGREGTIRIGTTSASCPSKYPTDPTESITSTAMARLHSYMKTTTRPPPPSGKQATKPIDRRSSTRRAHAHGSSHPRSIMTLRPR